MSTNDWFNRTIQDLFNETCQIKKDEIAIVYDGQAITFSQLQNNVNKTSNMLLDLGIKSGDRVTIVPTTTPQFIYVFYGVLQIGAIVNPIHLLWTADELSAVLQRNDPTVILTIDQFKGRDYIDLFKTAISDLKEHHDGSVSSQLIPSLKNIITVSDEGNTPIPFLNFNKLMENSSNNQHRLLNKMDKQKCTDIQFICQTSGTTDISKSALWNHRTPLSTTHFAAKNLGYHEEDSFINLAPFFHNSGILAIVLNLAYAGTTLYLLDDFNPIHAIECIEKYNITTTFGFTAHWEGMRSVPNFPSYDFTITKALLAGDTNAYDLVKEMCGERSTVNMLFAQTENGPLVSLGEYDCMNENFNRNTNGRPLPGIEVIVRNIDTDQIVQDGELGEICYKSPFLFAGYYKQDDETKKAFDQDGYFRSGDFGTFEKGYITYQGRLGGIIKSGGENVSLFRVTSILQNNLADLIIDAETVGVPDNYWGEKVVTWIRTRDGVGHLSLNTVKERCQDKMAAYEMPKEIHVWDGPWPMTGEGKVDYKLLTEKAQNLSSNEI